MATKLDLFKECVKLASYLKEPRNHYILSQNLLRVSIWGALTSGATASASFIFSRFLIQEGSCKEFASHVVKASLTSWATFGAVAVYCIYNIVIMQREAISRSDRPDDLAKALNGRVSLFAKGSTLIGLAGAAVAWAAQSATSNVQVSSLAKHSFSPLLGLGAVGSILWIFHHWQNKQLEASNEKK